MVADWLGCLSVTVASLVAGASPPVQEESISSLERSRVFRSPKIDQEAARVLQAASDTMRGLKSVRYRGEWAGVGAAAAIRGWVKTQVELVRLGEDEYFGYKFHATGSWAAVGSERQRETNVRYDGKTLLSLRSSRKRAIQGDPSRVQDRLMMTAGVGEILSFQFFSEKPLSSQLAAQQMTHEGRTLIGGVLCDIVYLEIRRDEDDPRRQRWYLSVEDHLPRRVEMIMNVGGRWGASVTTALDLEANPDIDGSVFDPSIPADYTVQTYEMLHGGPELLDVGVEAPDWMLKDPAGGEHRLFDYRGKLVLMDFWATWCAPCAKAMPVLQRLHEKFSDRGLVVLGINCQERSRFAEPEQLFRQRGFNYTLLLRGNDVSRNYRVRGIPAFFLLGADGKVLHRQSGHTPGTEAELEALIEEQLDSPPR